MQPSNVVPQLTKDVEVDSVTVNRNQVIKARIRQKYSLDELTSAITSENLHPEIEIKTVVGNEAW
jgi:antitoxin component of MazEF toxin-antitoxin module